MHSRPARGSCTRPGGQRSDPRRSAPFSEVSIGPWRVAVKAGSLEADPYTRAALERSGEIPLALGEGLQLVARVDSDRRPLDPRCLYRVGSRTPAARYWSLSLVDGKGFPVENAAGRYGFRSSEILRQSDGGFAVYVSALAHAGNWLPIGHVQDFALVLRLYDTPLAASAGRHRQDDGRRRSSRKAAHDHSRAARRCGAVRRGDCGGGRARPFLRRADHPARRDA